jgi:polysaccharide pyruvyl transferase WcaK-like protein
VNTVKSPKTINVLHLASFKGNIGDNANHNGSRTLFESQLGRTFNFKEVEIRSFYRGHRKFDEAFIEEVNSYDLFVVGGGNYFELWPENSKSGTSINFGVDDLKKIHTPTIFYSLGVDTGQGVAPGNKEKFRDFCEYAFLNDRFFISIRNDGARSNLTELYDGDFASKFTCIPDGGFFCRYKNNEFPFKSPRRTLVGLQIAGDMQAQRFKSSKDAIVAEFVSFISEAASSNPELDFVFFNHIPKDLELSTRIVSESPDTLSRERLFIAPYGQGSAMAEKIFGIYSQCDLVIANRFHANVVPISMNIPCIGISNFKQINGLYAELGLQDCLIEINSTGFSKALLEKTLELLANRDKVRERLVSLNSNLFLQTKDSYSRLEGFLKRNSL